MLYSTWNKQLKSYYLYEFFCISRRSEQRDKQKNTKQWRRRDKYSLKSWYITEGDADNGREFTNINIWNFLINSKENNFVFILIIFR